MKHSFYVRIIPITSVQHLLSAALAAPPTSYSLSHNRFAVVLAAVPLSSWILFHSHPLETHTFVHIVDPRYLFLFLPLLVQLAGLQINLVILATFGKDRWVCRPYRTTFLIILSLPTHSLLGLTVLSVRSGHLPLSHIIPLGFFKLLLHVSLVRNLGCALWNSMPPGNVLVIPLLLLLRNHLRELLMGVFILTFIRPLQASETATDVLAHFLHNCLLFAVVPGGLVEVMMPQIVHSIRLQFLNTDLRGAIVRHAGAGSR